MGNANNRRGMTRLTALAFVGLALAACGGDGSVAPPAQQGSLTIEATAGEWYPGDVLTLRAVVRDARGEVVAGAPVTWTVDDPARAELDAAGTATLLTPGAVTFTARSGALRATRLVAVQPLVVTLVTVTPSPLRLDLGGVGVLGVRVQGAGGRDVMGRQVTLTSDNPAIATIDAAGRVHAVAPGVTTVRATADGVAGTARVEVSETPSSLALSRVGGARLPLLVSGDTVTVFGERFYHEVFIESGTLALGGGTAPRYDLSIRYVEYRVTGPANARQYLPMGTWRERDFGTMRRDARGDLHFTSEYYWPLMHTAVPVSQGMQVRYRIPGDDQYLDLLYAPEP